MAGEGPVVRLDPRLLVAAGDEGPGRQGPGGRHHVVGQREGDAHLEQVAFGHEPLGGGPGVVGRRSACMTQRWTGSLRGASSHGPAQERRVERVASVAAAGSTTTCTTVDPSRAGESTATPDELGPVPGQDDALAVPVPRRCA